MYSVVNILIKFLWKNKVLNIILLFYDPKNLVYISTPSGLLSSSVNGSYYKLIFSLKQSKAKGNILTRLNHILYSLEIFEQYL